MEKERISFTKRKTIMYITVFTANAVLLWLEIIAGRMIAPYYGNTVYVWGSIVTVFMIALGAGEYIGGYLADSYEKEYKKVIGLIMLANIAAIYVIPYINQAVIEKVNEIIKQPALQPLAAVMIVYLTPSVLLGIIAPFAFKLIVNDMKKLGEKAGKIYAAGSLGCVVGTILATFVMSYYRTTVNITVLVIILTAIFVMLQDPFKKRPSKKTLLIYAVIAFLLVLPVITSRIFSRSEIENFTSGRKKPEAGISALKEKSIHTVPFAGEEIRKIIYSPYGEIEIKENIILPQNESEKEVRTRSITINGGIMGLTNKDNPLEVTIGWKYIELMNEITNIYKGGVEKALTLGLAGGLLQRKLIEKTPGIELEAVDINREVIRATGDYFGISEDISNLKIFNDDARAHLRKQPDGKYDAIYDDAMFYNKTAKVYIQPAHLITKEYYELAKQKMKKGGIYIKHYPDVTSYVQKELLASAIKTMREVFETVEMTRVYESKRNLTDVGQRGMSDVRIIIATNLKESEIRNNLIRKRVMLPGEKHENARVITDDYNFPFHIKQVIHSLKKEDKPFLSVNGKMISEKEMETYIIGLAIEKGLENVLDNFLDPVLKEAAVGKAVKTVIFNEYLAEKGISVTPEEVDKEISSIVAGRPQEETKEGFFRKLEMQGITRDEAKKDIKLIIGHRKLAASEAEKIKISDKEARAMYEDYKKIQEANKAAVLPFDEIKNEIKRRAAFAAAEEKIRADLSRKTREADIMVPGFKFWNF